MVFAGLGIELFVGNDMYRDIYGTRKLGIKTVFFKSNQGLQEKDDVESDFLIDDFLELLHAIK
ncbi:MAG: hypothetical protein JXR80_11080 [Deltaproteobacteria bacterium]|nr:hypothetical protein [Deltaproteobacteria bacterium]